MKIITHDLKDWAKTIQQEIEDDVDGEWFWPKAREHQIFEQAYMRFVNRNLNYFNFANMIAQVKEGNEFNPKLEKTLAFCRHVRTLSDSEHHNSPFGRMCVWNLPPGKQLLAHKDNYAYHRFITRNIFVISDVNSEKNVIRINGELVPIERGTLFQFFPATELHEFINISDSPFYFLGFDFWDLSRLQALFTLIDFEKIRNDPIRLSGFGGEGTPYKYISKH